MARSERGRSYRCSRGCDINRGKYAKRGCSENILLEEYHQPFQSEGTTELYWRLKERITYAAPYLLICFTYYLYILCMVWSLWLTDPFYTTIETTSQQRKLAIITILIEHNTEHDKMQGAHMGKYHIWYKDHTGKERIFHLLHIHLFSFYPFNQYNQYNLSIHQSINQAPTKRVNTLHYILTPHITSLNFSPTPALSHNLNLQEARSHNTSTSSHSREVPRPSRRSARARGRRRRTTASGWGRASAGGRRARATGGGRRRGISRRRGTSWRGGGSVSHGGGGGRGGGLGGGRGGGRGRGGSGGGSGGGVAAAAGATGVDELADLGGEA